MKSTNVPWRRLNKDVSQTLVAVVGHRTVLFSPLAEAWRGNHQDFAAVDVLFHEIMIDELYQPTGAQGHMPWYR